eukprot:5644970-Prymnesium_polylepis.1
MARSATMAGASGTNPHESEGWHARPRHTTLIVLRGLAPRASGRSKRATKKPLVRRSGPVRTTLWHSSTWRKPSRASPRHGQLSRAGASTQPRSRATGESSTAATTASFSAGGAGRRTVGRTIPRAPPHTPRL